MKDDFSELFVDLKEKLQENEGKDERTFLVFYYAGHGLMDTMTLAACNEQKNYPLEKQLRILATIKKSYIWAVFDCCRQKVPQLSRGGEEEEKKAEQHTNLVLTWGCPPSDTVPDKSTIAVAVFDHLRQAADDATGQVTLPGALIGWRGTDGKVETLPLTNVPLKLRFKDWVPRAVLGAGAQSEASNDLIRDVEELKEQVAT